MSRGSVLVALSGGVDSSVATALLVEQGWEVVAVTMKLWGGASDTGCCSVSDVDDARRVAQQLGVDHLVFNFTSDFERHVVAPYVADHAEGRTPNPCIECNRHLKFDRLVGRARLLGFDAVATGHHARVLPGPDGRSRVGRGADRAKDQSYVVHVLSPELLELVRFPVGGLTKAEVRARAEALGLRTAAKPDSQDVCFVASGRGGRGSFLAERAALRPAVVVDTAGRPVGSVAAVELVTVGQRRGLGGGGAEPRYVVDVDVEGAVVTVGGRADLLRRRQPVEGLVWAAAPVPGRVLAQCSAHGPARPARLGDGELVWEEPQRRVAPGQAVVLYDEADELVVGAATAT